MLVQEGVDGCLEGHGVSPGSRTTFPTGTPSPGVAANAGSSSVPRGRDSPDPAVIDKLVPQQIGCLLRQRQGRDGEDTRYPRAETTQTGYGGVLGLVFIIVLFVRHPDRRPRNCLRRRCSRSSSQEQPVNRARHRCRVRQRRDAPWQPNQAARPQPTIPATCGPPRWLTSCMCPPRPCPAGPRRAKLPFLKTLGGHRRYPESEIRELAEELREEAMT